MLRDCMEENRDRVGPEAGASRLYEEGLDLVGAMLVGLLHCVSLVAITYMDRASGVFKVQIF